MILVYVFLLAVKFVRKRNLFKADVKSLAAASFKDSYRLSKKVAKHLLKAGELGNFRRCVL